MIDLITTIFFNGTVYAVKKYRFLKFVYIGLVFAFPVAYSISIRSGDMILSILLITVLVIGIWESIKQIPQRYKNQSWESICEELGLKTKERATYFLYEKVISAYANEIALKTVIPLNIWHNKKSALEMRLNKKIIDIKQDKANNQIIKLIIQGEALSSKIDWKENFVDTKNNVLNIGIGYLGLAYMDLEKYPHAFIAGETGSGKSNILKCFIHQSLAKNYDVVLIDFKRGVSFSSFSDLLDIYYDYSSATKILDDMVNETNKRLDLFRTYKVDNLKAYNSASSNPLKRKIIFIDELAELLKTRDKAISNRLYDSIETLTRISRAVGIHLIMGIQRPDSTIINGQIKNNVSFRVCGRFVDREPSRIMLGSDEASSLVNIKGRFIIKDDELYEVQSFYYSDSDSNNLKLKSKEEISNIREPQVLADVEVVAQKSESISKELNFDFSDIKK